MAVVFPTTALRWKKSNLHQHKTESEKNTWLFSIGRNILGNCFALNMHRNREKQTKSFII